MPLEFDVAVVGGGPSGAVFALRMAELGHSVCVIERERFPRRHVGESLAPGVLPLLASLGVAQAASLGAIPIQAVSTNWSGTETARRDPGARGLLVDRGVFDSALLARARQSGVRLFQPATLRHRTEREQGFRLELETERGEVLIDARFLADASGRGSRLGARRRWTGPRTVAVHGYWRGRGLPSCPRIEATERAWYWGVPIPDGTYDTFVFVDEQRVRTERGLDRAQWLMDLLSASTLAEHLGRAELDGPARVTDATPYLDERCVGPRSIRLGEAALALDPLSSSGVQKAVQTALAGALVANTLLRRPADQDAAIRFYVDHLQRASARHQAWARQYYGVAASRFSDSFWSARAGTTGGAVASAADLEGDTQGSSIGDDAPMRLSTRARWALVPCLGAELVAVRQALEHPGLDGPVAFLGGADLAELLGKLPPSLTRLELAQRWSRQMPIERGLSLARWLAARGVLEPA